MILPDCADQMSYLAGYFDGEGCITVLKTNQGAYPQLRVFIVSSDKGVLELFSKAFSQVIYEVTKTHLGNGRLKRRIYRWSVSGSRAIPILRALEPHLISKRDQARAVLSVDWETTLRGKSRDEEMIKKRWWVKQEITRLKSLNLINREL
jgi:hypothetical protein